MPERMLRPGILTSEAVNQLSFAAEVFYRRLMSVVDDYGRFDGRAAILRANLYPLKLGSVVEPDVEKWLAECAGAGLVRVYEVEHKRYVMVEKFDQRLRAKKSKWPEPADSPPQIADIRGQMPADCQQPQTSATESESESESKSETLSEKVPFGNQQPAAIEEINLLLRELYRVTDRSGMQMTDKLSTLAIELAGVEADLATIRAFWQHRKKPPQFQYFAGDFVSWRAGQVPLSVAGEASIADKLARIEAEQQRTKERREKLGLSCV